MGDLAAIRRLGVAAAAAALSLVGAVPADAAGPCERRGAHVVQQDAESRLFWREVEDQRVFYGCLFRRDRARVLTGEDAGVEVSHSAVAGPYAVLVEETVATSGSYAEVFRYDLRNGRRVGLTRFGASNPAFGGPQSPDGPTRVGDVVLTRSGVVAWTEIGFRDGGGIANVSVRDSSGTRTGEREAPVEPGSLAAGEAGHLLYWRAGQARTAHVNPAAPAPPPPVGYVPRGDRRCAARGGEVIHQDVRGRVLFRPATRDRRGAVFGCLFREGRLRSLGGVARRLASPHVAVSTSRQTSDGTATTIKRIDLRTGARVNVSTVFSCPTCSEPSRQVHQLALTRAGSLAWSVSNERTRLDQQIERYDAGGRATLASGPRVDDYSLAVSVSGAHTYWLEDGVARSAPLGTGAR